MALLKFKRSAVPAKIPSIADLALGELAINTYDGKVYTKKDDGTQSIVEVGGNSSGITTITSTDGSVTVTGSGATRDLSVAVAGSTTNVVALVRNNTGATLAKGTVVYINGSIGQNSTVAKAIANSDATSAQTLGLMTANLANNATGYVTIIGLITGMDTSAFTDGQQLYLSPTTAGTFTATKPHAPQHLVYVAVVEHAHPSQGKLFVKVQNGYEMDELHDVSAQSPANNDGLFFNTTTSLWEKKSIATALGYTPIQQGGGTGQSTNKLYIGWTGSQLALQVDTSNFGATWPINVSGSAATVGTITSGQVTTALGYTPANKAGDTFTGSVTIPELFVSDNTPTFTSSAFQYHLHQSPHVAYVKQTGGYSWYWRRNSTGTLSGTSEVEDMSLTEGGDLIVRSTVRAPLFYDTPNTAYFVDPSGTSNIVGLTVANAITGSVTGNAATATKATNLNQARYANTDFNTLGSTGQFFRAYTNYLPSGGSYNQPLGGGQDFKVLQWGDVEGGDGATAGNWGGQIVQNFYTDQMWFRRSYATTWQAWREFIHDGNVGSFAMQTNASATNSVDVRAPIFYDSPNTAFFLDPSSTSVLSTVRANAIQHVNGTSAITLTDGSYLYLKSPDNGVRLYLGGADPANYYDNDTHYFRNRATSILASLSTGTGFVVGPNTSGQYTRLGGNGGATDMCTLSASNGNLHIDAKAANNLYLSWYNTATTFVGGGIAATVFVDRDNSAYFINPTDSQSIRTVGDWRSDSSAWTGEFAGKIQYHINNWYFQAAGSWEFRRSNAANAFSVTQAGLATAASSFDAPTFRDSNDTGYYLDPFSTGLAIKVNGNMECYARSASWSEGYRVRVPTRGTWGGIRFTREDANSNGNWAIGFTGVDSTDDLTFWGNLSGGEGMRARLTHAGNFTVYGATVSNQSYAQIFYDSNDGAYYADPANVSNFYRLSSYIAARDANANWNTGFTNTPAYSYNYHGDLNGGTNAPASGWWFYESMRHSNASNYWGTQIAWGWEDNANRMLQRNVSGNSFSAWVEYLNTSGRTYSGNLTMTGSIISSASDMRAPIFYDQNDTSTYVDPAGASWIKGGFQLMNPSASNDCFGGLEMRENGLVAASQSSASYAPRVNFHWGSRAAASLYMDSGGSFVFGGQSDITNNRRAIFCSDLYATGNVTAYYSDDRLKTRIGNIENALDIVSSLNGFRYVDNELAETFGYANNGTQLGVSAQEVQKHLPEIVRGAAFDVDHDDPDHGSKTGEHYLTVDYSRLVPLLIEAIKELRDEVEALKK